jgi:hypothetical protein
MVKLDVITIGRSSVDLYGRQIGGRLEGMWSLRKYVGGSPTNIAIGAARLGLHEALITQIGDEHTAPALSSRADENPAMRREILVFVEVKGWGTDCGVPPTPATPSCT